ncbi:MAG TPA: glycosyltransferase family 2 protein [Blastocatellia bacterium]|nr:glycosyltransferase family 2 protein [Blastocatellia bacterium]
MIVVELIFIASLLLIAYTYVGYPALAFALSRLFARPVRRAEIEPKVSVIIAAYNEEGCIAEKLENTLALDYPKDKLEIIVASDCSTDGTDAIARSYANRGVKLYRQPKRFGKTVAQNEAVKVSSGEILVFSDATTMYERDALRKIVRSFANPEVGCVAGQLIYADRAASAVGQGCRSYWGYEKFLKHCESRLGSLIGVSGCLYAVRRSNYARMAQDMSSDFAIATEIYLQGLRTVYDPEAIAFEDTNKRGRDEFRMRVRIIEQTMSAMHAYREALNPRRHGMFAFQMLSHKALRYAVPIFLILAFASNALLAGESEIYNALFLAQVVFYLAALAVWACDRAGLRLGLLGLPYYFVLANLASLVAFVKFIRGEAHVVWEPIREGGPAGENSGRRVAAGGVPR